MNQSFNYSLILPNGPQPDPSFDVDIDEIMHLTDQQTFKQIISQTLERDLSPQHALKPSETSKFGGQLPIGFSSNRMPQKIQT
jgi:hypothetical protein